jgi:hypothetical protein
MGFGDELDLGKGKMLPAGSIFEMPATIHHFGWPTEETIIQEHGIGPLNVNYLKPAHDAPHRVGGPWAAGLGWCVATFPLDLPVAGRPIVGRRLNRGR